MDIVQYILFIVAIPVLFGYTSAYIIGRTKFAKLAYKPHPYTADVDLDELVAFLRANLQYLSLYFSDWEVSNTAHAIRCKVLSRKIDVIITFSSTDAGKKLYMVSACKVKVWGYIVASGSGISASKTNAGFGEYRCLYMANPILAAALEWYFNLKASGTPPVIEKPVAPLHDRKKNSLSIIIPTGVVIAVIVLAFVIRFGAQSEDSPILNSPSTSIIYESSNSDVVSLNQTYTSDTEGIAFRYPDMWEITDVSELGVSSIVCITVPTVSDYSPNMIIDKDEDNSIFEYTKEDFKKAYSALYDDKAKVIDIVDTSLSEVLARKLTLSIEDVDVGDVMGVQYYYILNRYLYTITFTTLQSDFDTYEPIFNAIIESYEITQSEDEPSTESTGSESESENTDIIEITYEGSLINQFLNCSTDEVKSALGSPTFEGGTEAGYVLEYDGISFVFDDEYSFCNVISVWETSLLSIDGVTLDKNRSELIAALGEPTYEGWVDDEYDLGYSVYQMEYFVEDSCITIVLSVPEAEAESVTIYY